MRSRPARHSFGEHVGEVVLRIEAPTLRELFEEAGRALAELGAEVPPEGAPRDAERIELRRATAHRSSWPGSTSSSFVRRRVVYEREQGVGRAPARLFADDVLSPPGSAATGGSS
jgi:hypothetical protein